MNDDKSVMKYETTLPADFDGVFRFTNWSDEEFIGVWGKKEYHFPAQSTSPLIIPEHSPLEIQHIRKKFAKDLAEREFFKSRQYEAIRIVEGPRDEIGMITPRLNSSLHAGQYSLDTLAPFIQKALQPLPIAKAIVQEAPVPNLEERLSRNKKGKLNTQAVEDDNDLEKMAKE